MSRSNQLPVRAARPILSALVAATLVTGCGKKDPGSGGDAPGGALVGHVFLFCGSLRECLLVHLSTSVPSARDEGVLSNRLAVLRSRVLKSLTLDPSRITEDATVPRDRPTTRH